MQADSIVPGRLVGGPTAARRRIESAERSDAVGGQPT